MRLGVALSVLLASSTPVLAAPIVVDSTSGANNVAGSCTLRDAITSANSDTAVGGCTAGSGSDTISLPAGVTITLTEMDNYTNGANGLPAIASSIIIEGNGAIIARDKTVVCSNLFNPTPPPGLFRFFYTAPGSDLTLHGLVLTDGCIVSDISGTSSGGSIYNAGQTSVQHVLIRNSLSGFGGAIFNDGNLVVDRTTFDSNSFYGAGGAIADSSGGHDTLVTNSVFRGNFTVGHPNRGVGGAIYHDTGTLTLRNDTFTQNIAYRGAALRLNTGPSFISNVTISDNSAFSVEDDIGISSSAAGTSVAKITNSILATSSFGFNCGVPPGYLEAVGTNLSSDSTCAGFTLSSTNPQFGSVGQGGIAPGYLVLQASSPAVDGAVSCLDASGTLTIADDQRGRPRPYGTNCDLGAYERDDFLFANGFEP